MHAVERSEWEMIVAGVGTPHGDDQAGWLVATLLGRYPDLPARVLAASEPLEVFDVLEGCQRLILVDACRRGGNAGTVTRLSWPDVRIVQASSHSTHGFCLAEVLLLAERLDVLPPSVDIWAIEGESFSPGKPLTQAVADAATAVAERIILELCEITYA